MLETGCRRPSIAGTPHPKRPHRVGDGPVDPRALGTLGLVGVTPCTRPGGLPAPIGFLGSPGDRPPRGTGPVKAARAGLAITRGELHLDALVVHTSGRGSPPETRWSRGTDGLLPLPVAHQGAGIEAVARARRPCVIGPCRAQPCDALGALGGDHAFGIAVPGSDELEAWPQRFGWPRFVEGLRHGGIGHGPSRRLYGGDPRRWVRVATLRDVPLAAPPGGGVLLGLGRLQVIRRADHACGWWPPCGGRAPADPGRGAIARLPPDAAQGLDRRGLSPPPRGRFCLTGVQSGVLTTVDRKPALSAHNLYFQ